MLAGSVLVSLANFGYNIGVAHLLGARRLQSRGGRGHAAHARLLHQPCVPACYRKIDRQNQQARRTRRRLPVPDAPRLAGRLRTLGHLRRSQPLDCRLPANAFPTLVVLLGLGMLFYIPLGVRRGGMQGTCQFLRLSLNLAAEAFVKLIAAMVLVLSGAGVLGAVGAISLSVFAAFLLPAGDRELRQIQRAISPARFWRAFRPSFSLSAKSSSATSTS